MRARQRLALEREAKEEADAAAEAESAAANATAAKEAAAAAAAAAALDGLGPLVAALVRVLDVAAGVDVPAALAASKALRELAEDAGARPALAQHGAGTLVLRRCREAEDTAEPAGIALMEDAALTLRQLCEDEATAGALLAAGAPGKRTSLANARVMIHQPMGGARGQASDIHIQAQEILKLRHKMNEILAAHTGRSVDQVAADTERDYYMSADEARDYGIVDAVASQRNPTSSEENDSGR